jgi:hypothetical protein
MHDTEQPDWKIRLERLRARSVQAPPLMVTDDLSGEALMTIVAIMKDNDDPKLQMAAAKMLLDKNMKMPSLLRSEPMTSTTTEAAPPTADDIDAAIALAKAVLDELAFSKTQKLDGAGAMVADRTAGTDNAAR